MLSWVHPTPHCFKNLQCVSVAHKYDSYWMFCVAKLLQEILDNCREKLRISAHQHKLVSVVLTCTCTGANTLNTLNPKGRVPGVDFINIPHSLIVVVALQFKFAKVAFTQPRIDSYLNVSGR